MTNQFVSTSCSDCHVVPSETDLFPLYAAWSNRLERYVIFTKNSLNGKVEQYVYEKDYEGFQQVSQPELQFDANRISTSNDFFTVGGTEIEGVTSIRRDEEGHFRKEQLNWGTNQFEQLPAVPVKMLVEEQKGSGETVPITVQVPVETVKEIVSDLKTINTKENQILRVNTVRITAPLRKRKTEVVGFGGDAKKDTREVPVDESKETRPRPPEHQQQRHTAGDDAMGTKTKLSIQDIAQIRHIAAMMGNPKKAHDDSSDDADYTTDSDGGASYDVVESSC